MNRQVSRSIPPGECGRREKFGSTNLRFTNASQIYSVFSKYTKKTTLKAPKSNKEANVLMLQNERVKADHEKALKGLDP